MVAMAEWIPKILNFGFLGLSFLMVYLGYRLTNRVVEQSAQKPEVIQITKFFLIIAVAFMILAGPLQWATIWITSRTQEKSIVLFVGANNPSWEKEYGEVYISVKGKLIPISRSSVKEEVSNNEDIKIELSQVAKVIENMRQQLIRTNELKKTPELKDTLGGG
jgi:predicted HAD superfamily hydrolase